MNLTLGLTVSIKNQQRGNTDSPKDASIPYGRGANLRWFRGPHCRFRGYGPANVLLDHASSSSRAHGSRWRRVVILTSSCLDFSVKAVKNIQRNLACVLFSSFGYWMVAFILTQCGRQSISYAVGGASRLGDVRDVCYPKIDGACLTMRFLLKSSTIVPAWSKRQMWQADV